MSQLRWERTVTVHALREAGGLLSFAGNSFELALYAVDDEIFATADLCTHGGGRLSQGYREGHLIECPLHQGLFDIRTGAAAGPPCTRAVQTFPVRIEDDAILVGLPSSAAEAD